MDVPDYLLGLTPRPNLDELLNWTVIEVDGVELEKEAKREFINSECEEVYMWIKELKWLSGLL